jgi:hypothetical protein
VHPDHDRLNSVIEAICVLVVVAALVALVVWILFHTGGGVLNQG